MAEFGGIRRPSPHWHYKYPDPEAGAVVRGVLRAVGGALRYLVPSAASPLAIVCVV